MRLYEYKKEGEILKKIIYLFVVFFLLVVVGDTITTINSIENGGIESNPVMGKILDNYGLVWFIVIKIVLVIIILSMFWKIYKQFPKATIFSVLQLNIVYLLIITNNIINIDFVSVIIIIGIIIVLANMFVKLPAIVKIDTK